MSEAGARTIWRLAWMLAVVAGTCAGYLVWQPMVGDAANRVGDARAQLQSDRIAFATRASLERERSRLRRRYASTQAGYGESDFVRRLSVLSRKRRVRVISAEVAPPNSAEVARKQEPAALEAVNLRLELQGSYRGLLLAIDDLSRESDLVRVDSPSLRATGLEVDASVPIILLRPSERS
jgi:hypothetical protein